MHREALITVRHARMLVSVLALVALISVPPARTHVAAAAPTVVYATLLGGAAGNFDGIQDLAVDVQGNAYVTGQTESSDFPIKNALDPAPPLRNQQKAFVAKFAPDGALVFSTFLGSRDNNSNGSAIAVDQTGAIYVAGSTGDGFPIKNTFQSTIGGLQDAFIAKLSADGSSIVYASYLGGNQSETVRDIALDADGRVYIVGEVTGTAAGATFPTIGGIQNGYGGGQTDAFLSVVSPDGQVLQASTLVDVGLKRPSPAAADDRVTSLVVHPSTHDVFMSGGLTFSADTPNERKEPFVLRMRFEAPAPASSIRPLYVDTGFFFWMVSDHFADINDQGGLTPVEKIIMGWLAGTANLTGSEVDRASPLADLAELEVTTLVSGVCRPASPGVGCDEPLSFVIDDADFKTKRKATVKFGRDFFPDAVTQDRPGHIYVAGDTALSQLHTLQPIQSTLGGSDDVVIAAYNRQTFEPAFITYFGGNGLETPTSIKVDAQGNIYVAGIVTIGTTFPSTPGAFQRDIKGRNDGFLVKISPVFP